MKIDLLALGTKMPDWVDQGYLTYAKRFHRPWQLSLHTLAIPKRSPTANLTALKAQEGQALLKASQKATLRIALDEHGETMSTQALATLLADLAQQHQHIAMLIGGPDGHSDQCLTDCQRHWSLSPLTLPHGLVRIIVAEQLYRAITIIQGHPYHRD